MNSLTLLKLGSLTVVGSGFTGLAFLLLADLAVKVSAILIVAALACFLLFSASAALRHAVWVCVLASALAMPALSVVLPELQVLPGWMSLSKNMENRPAISDMLSSPTEDSVGSRTTTENTAAAADEPLKRDVGSVSAPIDPDRRDALAIQIPASAVLTIWLTGFLVCIGPSLLSYFRLRRIESQIPGFHATSEKLKPKIEMLCGKLGVTCPRVIVGEPGTMPMVWTFLRSRLYLPADACEWPAAQLDSVLLHELVHLRRRDPLAMLIGQVARALNWFNPLAWYAFRQMRIERERACDDFVLNFGVQPPDYAEHLLRMATVLQRPAGIDSVALAMASSSQVESRLNSILDQTRNRRKLTRTAMITLLAIAGLLAVIVSSLTAMDSKEDDDSIKWPYCVLDNIDRSNPRSLDDVVADFNEHSKHSPIGNTQPMLTRQEVMAGIEKAMVAKHVSDPVKKILTEIKVSGQLPPETWLRRFTRYDDGSRFYGVWWVMLVVGLEDRSDLMVPIRQKTIFSRPYTQPERQQNAQDGVRLIGRHSSYFEDLPSRVNADVPQKESQDLIQRATDAIKAKDVDRFKALFEWNGVSDSTREFVESEFEFIISAEVHSITVAAQTWSGQMKHFSGYNFSKSNLPVIGYLNIDCTHFDRSVPQRPAFEITTLSYETGKSADGLKLANYVSDGTTVAPEGKLPGWTMSANYSQDEDGKFLLTWIITNPDSLISAHLANEEIWKRDLVARNQENTAHKHRIILKLESDGSVNFSGLNIKQNEQLNAAVIQEISLAHRKNVGPAEIEVIIRTQQNIPDHLIEELVAKCKALGLADFDARKTTSNVENSDDQ